MHPVLLTADELNTVLHQVPWIASSLQKLSGTYLIYCNEINETLSIISDNSEALNASVKKFVINDRDNLYYDRTLTSMVRSSVEAFKNNPSIHCYSTENLESIPERVIGDVEKMTLNSSLQNGWFIYTGTSELLRWGG